MKLTYTDDEGRQRKIFERLNLTKMLGIQLNIGEYFESRCSIDIYWWFGGLKIALPFKSKRRPDCTFPEYGIMIMNFEGCDHSIQVHYGLHKCKVIYLPWFLDHYRTTYYGDNGIMVTQISLPKRLRKIWSKYNTITEHSMIRDFLENNSELFHKTYDFTYTLNDGTVQHRKATICVIEREWRRYWMMWCPWFNDVSKTIDIRFDEEVGEKTGTWKGGVTGISCEMLEGETPEQTLRRFEKTAKL